MDVLKPVFMMKLNQKILPGTVCVGCFDSEHPSLASADTAGKVSLYPMDNSQSTPYSTLETDAGGQSYSDVTVLNVNEQVKAMISCQLKPNCNREALILGTNSHFMAYDVENNCDLFYKEIPDGVNCIAAGLLENSKTPVAVCGGNCFVQGFDWKGNDVFWSVTGGNVCSMCLCDFDNDKQLELIVGSEDRDIRVFKGDEIIAEFSETAAVISLYAVSENRFVYALINGTLGLYEGSNRLWRIKSKTFAMSLCLYDINGDGELELAAGWSNGKIDFRSWKNGTLIIKDHLNVAVVGLAKLQLPERDVSCLLCCSIDGEVRGYMAEASGMKPGSEAAQNECRALSLQKQSLLLELKNYEGARKWSPVREPDFSSQKNLSVIPASTQVRATLCVNPGSEKEEPYVQLRLTTNNDTIIRAAVLFAEGAFAGESYVAHPDAENVSSMLDIPIKPEKDITIDLHIKAVVGYKYSVQFHVFELTRELPRFSMYALCNENAPPPDCSVSFHLNDRQQKLADWIGSNFLTPEENYLKGDALQAKFFSLHGAGMLFFEMNADGDARILCNDMAVCGAVIQAMAADFGITYLESKADFKSDVSLLVELLKKVDEIYMARSNITGVIAEKCNLAKSLLIRAEDAKAIGNFNEMKSFYKELNNVNKELVTHYNVHCANHAELLIKLKQINTIIQNASNLRVGKAKADVTNACREAIKTGQTNLLERIIWTGS